jgi:hypothetical protein
MEIASKKGLDKKSHLEYLKELSLTGLSKKEKVKKIKEELTKDQLKDCSFKP